MQNENKTPTEINPELRAIARQRWGTIEQRFWRKVVKAEGEDSCWIWIGARNEHGYGSFFFRNRTEKAHRVSWILEHGDFPFVFDVLHKCDTPSCVRPSHLFLGNAKINGVDASNKRRYPHGESHWGSVATEEIVRAIRNEFVPRTPGLIAALSRKYGLTEVNTRQIVYGQSWNHLPSAVRGVKINQKSSEQIINLRASGVSTVELAKMFHVSNSTIKNVLNRKYASYGLAY